MDYPFEMEVRVPLRDVDLKKVVHHSKYLIYAEMGRIEYVRERGVPYTEIVDRWNVEFVVSEAHCSYETPARFDELLTLGMGFSDLGRAFFKLHYELHRHETADLIARMKTHHVCVDLDHFKPTRIPEPLRAMFQEDLVEEG